MTILSRHIFREFMTLVAGVLLVILIVYLSVEFLQKADKLIKYRATGQQIVRYFLYGVPAMVSMALPMATLIASLLAIGNLSRHNEIVAMRASGLSLMRIILPLCAGGLLVSAAGFVNTEYIMPVYSAKANYIRNVEIEKKQQRVMFQQHQLWLRGPENSIAKIEIVSPNRNEMQGLNIYKLNPDYSVKERISARSLVWENGAWKLKHSRTFTRDGDAVVSRSSDDEVFNLIDSPDNLGMIVKSSQEMNFQELWDYVTRLKSSGYQTIQYEVDLHTKLSYPLSSFLMVLISIPFSFHKVRSGGTGKGFALALMIAFFYWALASVGASLGHTGTIPPVASAWFANVFFAVVSFVVLVRMQLTT